jgi:hypothetical protein
MALTAAAFGQENPQPGEAPTEINEPAPGEAPVSVEGSVEANCAEPVQVDRNGTVSGILTDQAGAFVPNLRVTLTEIDSHDTWTTTSDTDGNYRFEQLPSGSYALKVDGTDGFDARSVSFSLKNGDSIYQPLELSSSTRTVTMGVMAVMPEYKTPLAAAIASDDEETFMDLIAHGADVNKQEDDRSTPLFIAVENGTLQMVRKLLDLGARVNARDEQKQTALMQLDGDATSELVELMLTSGAKINLIDKSGNTALMMAARNASYEVIQALIDGGADVNAINDEGRSALMNAADNNSVESVRALLLAGAKVNLRNKDGESAWDMTGDNETEDLLVSFGAETDSPTVADNEDKDK